MTANPYNGFTAEFRDRQGRLIREAIRAGDLAPPRACRACRTPASVMPVHCHLEDYFAWRDYIPLCYQCHMAVHRRFAEPATWARWKALVRHGWRPTPAFGYGTFVRQWHAVGRMARKAGGAPTFLDRLPDVEPDIGGMTPVVPPAIRSA